MKLLWYIHGGGGKDYRGLVVPSFVDSFQFVLEAYHEKRYVYTRSKFVRH